MRKTARVPLSRVRTNLTTNITRISTGTIMNIRPKA
jgi:hypothetical protein